MCGNVDLEKIKADAQSLIDECSKSKKQPLRIEVDGVEMEFKDGLDLWLYNNFRIKGGSCSSIEELKYSVARMVAEKLWW